MIVVESIKRSPLNEGEQRKAQNQILETTMNRVEMLPVRPSSGQLALANEWAGMALAAGASPHEDQQEFIAGTAASCGTSANAQLSPGRRSLAVRACARAAAHVVALSRQFPEAGQSELRSKLLGRYPVPNLELQREARGVVAIAGIFAIAELNGLVDAGVTQQSPLTGDLVLGSVSASCAVAVTRTGFRP